MSTPKSIALYFQEGGSDKVYNVQLKEEGAGWVVNFQFGRRGSSLQTGTKTKAPVSFAAADSIFEKLVAEKKGKGYSEGPDSTPFQGAPAAQRYTGILPQLSNPLSESEMDALMTDSAWAAQQKFDGERRLVDVPAGSFARGVNRKGLEVPLPKSLCDEVEAFVKDAPCVIDGEMVGETFYAFDLLSRTGTDLRLLQYSERYAQLEQLVSADRDGSIRLVRSAITTEAKRALMEDLQLRGLEGAVYKRLAAPYTPGRPNSGGDSRKFKFVESATVEVSEVSPTKRSVAVRAYDGTAAIALGNVTIPPNHVIPDVGAIVEVQYLYAFRGGSLFQPVYKGERRDMDASAAVIEQLKYKPEVAAAA